MCKLSLPFGFKECLIFNPETHPTHCAGRCYHAEKGRKLVCAASCVTTFALRLVYSLLSWHCIACRR